MLTDLHGDRWHKLHVKYNYQIHQMQWVGDVADADTTERNRDFGELSVVHFSGHTAPHDILWWRGGTTEDMANKIGRSCNIKEKPHWDITK